MEENNFSRELTNLLNRYSKENISNTPDFILASYIESCLQAFNQAVVSRESWYGRSNNLFERKYELEGK